MDKIEELENKIKEIQEELNKLKEEKKITKRWRGKWNERYFYIDDEGDIEPNLEDSEPSPYDTFRYDTGNYFRTKEQAEEHKERLLIYQQLKDLALELNNEEKINWGNSNQAKYCLFYNFNANEIQQNCYMALYHIGQIYCLNGDFLDVAIERIGEANLKKLFMED